MMVFSVQVSLVSILLLLFYQVTAQQSSDCLSSTRTCPGVSERYPAVCCYEIFRCSSLSPSGYYWIRVNGTVQSVHCEMDLKKITAVTPGSSGSYPAESCRDVYDCNPHAQSEKYWIKASRSSHSTKLYCNMSDYNATVGTDTEGQSELVYLIKLLTEEVKEIKKVLLSSKIFQSCTDAYKKGNYFSRVYHINPPRCGYVFPVYCQMSADEQWIVFQRRQDGSENFNRSWVDYVNGFGDLEGEHWLGLEKIYCLAKGGAKLRIDLEDFENETRYAVYSNFSLSDASDYYRLHVSGYSGDAGDHPIGLENYHNGQQFSTYDADHDSSWKNCAKDQSIGGGWFASCAYVNLNGLYLRGDYTGRSVAESGVFWQTFRGDNYSLKFTEMKLNF